MYQKPGYPSLPKRDWAKHRAAVFEIRRVSLRGLGWDSYQEYLESDTWKQIREQVFEFRGRLCPCGRRATQIHHAKYDQRTLEGKNLEHLWPCCGRCHSNAESSKAPPKIVANRIWTRGRSRRRKSKKRKRKRRNPLVILEFEGGEIPLYLNSAMQSRFGDRLGDRLVGLVVDGVRLDT